ncbi:MULTISPECIES: triose-phosphate isomerase [unclassified Iodidimonas]|jgi:triosephosphate isomerase|uniref:triose-phosphate isomerase n=1 Tax=unclassified Iodidimonas TaxID=2626145 RepID=UPI00248269A7|nr:MULTISPECIES: triose-phosphate isomerase [unclassified Iodidimonas]
MSQPAIRPLVAGNWKMFGLRSALAQIERLRTLLAANPSRADCAICPPFTLIDAAIKITAGSTIAIGAQDCHSADEGAHTGDIAAPMLADLGVRHVIIGHSERRTDHGESDSLIMAKALAAHKAGLSAIICVGETLAQRDAGAALEIVIKQLEGSVPDKANAANCIIAYEPVWAIGTGRTPQTDDIAQMHQAIRSYLTKRFEDGGSMRILYGGSVKPKNAGELMSVAHVNGALVGGASLDSSDFNAILDAYRR